MENRRYRIKLCNGKVIEGSGLARIGKLVTMNVEAPGKKINFVVYQEQEVARIEDI